MVRAFVHFRVRKVVVNITKNLTQVQYFSSSIFIEKVVYSACKCMPSQTCFKMQAFLFLQFLSKTVSISFTYRTYRKLRTWHSNDIR